MKKLPVMMVLKGDAEYGAEVEFDKAAFAKLYVKTEELVDDEKKRWDESLYAKSLFEAAMFLIKAACKEIDESTMPLNERIDLHMQLMQEITTRPVFQMLAQMEALSVPSEHSMLN